MLRFAIAVAIVVLAGFVAERVRARRLADPPTQPSGATPEQVDRRDFDGDGWLVAVFTSESCSTCADVVSKAQVLASGDVTVQVASFQARRDLHERYKIDSVPCVLIVDEPGVVRRSMVGPVTATDLWAAVAEARTT